MSGIGNYGPPQSGLEAFVSGVSGGYGGVSDAIRKRQLQQQADADRQREIQRGVDAEDRANIAAGVGTLMPTGPSSSSSVEGDGMLSSPMQQGVRPDAVSAARQQVGGIRAAIGGILSRFNTPPDQPTTHLVRTGPSSAEMIEGIKETGANSRNERSVSAGLQEAQMRITAQAQAQASILAEERRNHDFEHSDRQAGNAVQSRNSERSFSAMTAGNDLQYAGSLDRSISAIDGELQRDSKGLVLQFGGDMAKVAQYRAGLQNQKGDLIREKQGILGKMRGRSIGQQLMNKPTVQRTGGSGGGIDF